MTLSNPIRLEVKKRLAEILREIKPSNGFVNDMSGAEGTTDNKVFRGRLTFGETDPLPMLSILEVPIPLDQLPPPSDSSESTGLWELMVQGFAVDDRDNPTDEADILLADVKMRLAEEKAKANWDKPEDGILGLGRFVIGLNIGPGVVRPPDEVSAKAYFWLTISLDLAEDLDDPYAAKA